VPGPGPERAAAFVRDTHSWLTGELDYRDADRDGRPGVEFSWQGSDEGDEVSGRGWGALNADGTLEGHVYFHLGDDSGFRAERFNGVESPLS
jgi:hypothetical protein